MAASCHENTYTESNEDKASRDKGCRKYGHEEGNALATNNAGVGGLGPDATHIDERIRRPEMRDGAKRSQRARERLVRSVMRTRIVLPSRQEVSDTVLRAVLGRNVEELLEAVRRKRLTDAEPALHADTRGRIALHLAAGTGDVQMVRALMRWRCELRRGLQDELSALNYRRTLYVRDTLHSMRGHKEHKAQSVLESVEHFFEWVRQERRRLVRELEVKCEGLWRKVVTARDYLGRTPLHWAASVASEDGSLLETILTCGRANLSVRMADDGDDRSALTALRNELRGASLGAKDTDSTGSSLEGGRSSLVFPRAARFHRATGRMQQVQSPKSSGINARYDDEDPSGAAALAPLGVDGVTAGAAKMDWFCDLVTTKAAELAGRGTQGAEAFLMCVFEDFDGDGDGVLSLRQLREALHDLEINVSEQTLLEVGRYFQTEGDASSCHRQQTDGRQMDATRHHKHSFGRADALDDADIELSFVALVDRVFGQKTVSPKAQRTGTARPQAGQKMEASIEQDSLPSAQAKETNESAVPRSSSTAKELDDTGDDGSSSSRYVCLREIHDARISAVNAADGLGRPPLFLAAAAGAVAAAKVLVRHGAASAVEVEGTRLTAHDVASNSLMRRALSAEARQALDNAIATQKRGKARASSATCPPHVTRNEREVTAGSPEDRCDDAPAEGTETDASSAYSGGPRKTEAWVSILADGEEAPTRAGDTAIDEKTSLHLAASAGLTGMVDVLLGRGTGTVTSKASPRKPAWVPSWGTPQRARINHLAPRHIHHNSVPRKAFKCDVQFRTDANGWNPLHGCCQQASHHHLRCALALMGTSVDPNSRTLDGKTSLHIAASGKAGDSCQSALVAALASHGADLEAVDGEGIRPLHYAARAGCQPMLLSLLVAGADPYATTPRGWNAMHYAVAGGHSGATRLLAYWDSDSCILAEQRNRSGVSPGQLARTEEVRKATRTIWEAAARGQLSCLARTYRDNTNVSSATRGCKPWDYPGVNETTPGLGFTALHACMAGLAAVRKSVDVSRPSRPASLGRGADAQSRPSIFAKLILTGSEKAATTHDRILCGRRRSSSDCISRPTSSVSLGEEKAGDGAALDIDYVGVCRWLLSAAADVDALDARMRTPLALAASAGSSEIIEMLLRAGADPKAIDVDGNTPLHFALAYANASAAACLVEAGGCHGTRNADQKTPQEVAGLRDLLAR